jgi:antitoxin component YwqK of YwqJK toxin-antitoxin module
MLLRKIHIAFFFSVLTFMIIGCKRPIQTMYDTGELKESYEIDKDKSKHGKYTRYHINGTIAEESTFDHGKQIGIKKIFTDRGILESEIQYQNGIAQGYYRVYYPTGNIKVDAQYVKGQLAGVFKQFYENGNLREVVNLDDGEENGPFEEYYLNGKLRWKGTYKNGDHEFGLLEEYDSTGLIIKKMFCDSLHICKTTWKRDEDK